MKICFIYSGLSRTLIDSIKLLNDKFKHIKYDIYIHTEINETDNNYLNKNFNIEQLYSLKNVKCVLLDYKPDIPDIFKTEKEINMYYQWFKIYRIYSIINDKDTYDYIVRIRSDLFILDDIENIIIKLNLSRDILYIPYGNDIYDIRHINYCDSINDQFAIGSIDVMNKYCNLFNYINEYYTPDTCSEIVLAKYLKTNDIKIERFILNYKLVLSLCNVIGITGNSASGKSTITNIIEKVFKFDKKIILETDRYHKWDRYSEEWNKKTHLNPEANYLEKLQEDTFNLKLGNDIYTVDYNHFTGKFTPIEKIQSKENIILCGLHTLYHDKLRDIIDIKVYIDTEESLQYYWKLKRDVGKRGYTEEKVLKTIELRKNDYIQYILPQKKYSDIIVHFYTNEKIDIYNWKNIDTPEIFLKLYLKIYIYNIIQDDLKNINIFLNNYYENDYIIFKINNKIDKLIIYNYLLSKGFDFISIDDIYEGYYGIIQLIFALILYKS